MPSVRLAWKRACLLVVVPLLAAMLHGCGGGGGSHEQPATTTTGTTTGTSMNPDLEAVKDFDSIGVAYSMLSLATWKAGPGTPSKFNIDAAYFYKDWKNPVDGKAKQAMSITSHKKWQWPYHEPDMGYTNIGLILSLREEDGWWKYFETSPKCAKYMKGLGAPLMSNCGDCFDKCCGEFVGDKLAGEELTYDQWKQHVDDVVEKTGSLDQSYCNKGYFEHRYNEFSTNGLSYDAVFGVFNDTTPWEKGNPKYPDGNQAPKHGGLGTHPDEKDLCKFFAVINEHKRVKRNTPWPIYAYSSKGFKQDSESSSALQLTGYLKCDEEVTVTV